MKKVLALVLVAVMAFGMASVGFAATTNEKITNIWANSIGYGYGSATVYEYYNFYIDSDGKKVVTTDPAKLGLSYDRTTYVSGKERVGALDGRNEHTVTYGTDIVPHDKVKDYINLYAGMFAWGNLGADANGGTLPERYVSYYYDGTKNTAGNWNVVGYPNYFMNISSADIRNSKVAVRTSVSAGSKAIDSVSIKNKDGYIEIKYVEEYVSTKSLDFDFTVYLTIDGKRYSDEGLTFVGTLANPITEVYANDDYVDLSYGHVAEAMEFVPKIEVDLGNGVSIFTKFFKTKKYYGTSTRDADEYDDIVFAKYADIDNVVTLKTVGLNSTGDIVKLSTDYNDYFVYDVNMNYLGQSNTMLPYSTKYYLANKKLDITSDDAVIDETGDAPTGDALNPNTGGDDLPSSNPNGNPSTGR